MSRVSLPSWLNSKLIENGILYPQLNSKLLCVDTKSDDRWLLEQRLTSWKRQWGNMLRESDWIVLCGGRHCSGAGKCSKMLDLQRFKIQMALTDVFWKKIKTPQTQKCNGQRCPTWTQFKFIFFPTQTPNYNVVCKLPVVCYNSQTIATIATFIYT